jgi:GT2 family glycosyltransferase
LAERGDGNAVAAVVLTWNSAACVTRALDSLTTSNQAVDVVVVDNGSSDNSRELVATTFPDITLVSTGANLGYAGGNNVGIKLALERGADYILLMNPDAYVTPECVDEMLVRLTSAPDLAAVSPIILNHGDGTIWYAGSEIDWKTGATHHIGANEKDIGQYDDVEFTSRGNGCVMLFRSEALRSVGLLDERYFLYYEETDWSVRAMKKGMRIAIAPKARAYHEPSLSTGGSGGRIYQYYLTRNRLLFLHDHTEVSFLRMTESTLRAAAVPTVALLRTRPRAAFVSGYASVRGWIDYCLRRFGQRRSIVSRAQAPPRLRPPP